MKKTLLRAFLLAAFVPLFAEVYEVKTENLGSHNTPVVLSEDHQIKAAQKAFIVPLAVAGYQAKSDERAEAVRQQRRHCTNLQVETERKECNEFCDEKAKEMADWEESFRAYVQKSAAMKKAVPCILENAPTGIVLYQGMKSFETNDLPREELQNLAFAYIKFFATIESSGVSNALVAEWDQVKDLLIVRDAQAPKAPWEKTLREQIEDSQADIRAATMSQVLIESFMKQVAPEVSLAPKKSVEPVQDAGNVSVLDRVVEENPCATEAPKEDISTAPTVAAVISTMVAQEESELKIAPTHTVSAVEGDVPATSVATEKSTKEENPETTITK